MDPTLLQTTLNPQRHIRRHHGPPLVQLLPTQTAQGRLHNIVLEPQQRLRRLLHAGVLTPEPGHEDGILAVRVELGVQRPLREHGDLVRLDRVDDVGRPVFELELRDQRALHDDVDFRTARVRVRRVEAAGPKEAEGHAHAGADQGGEAVAVGAHGVAAFAGGGGVGWGRVEVENVVGGIGEEVEAVFGCGSEEEGLNEGGVGRGRIRIGRCSTNQGKKEGDEDNRSLHCDFAELMT